MYEFFKDYKEMIDEEPLLAFLLFLVALLGLIMTIGVSILSNGIVPLVAVFVIGGFLGFKKLLNLIYNK